MKRSTIKDVAKTAEVNISTVSRVINGSPAISPATRTRVLQAIKELGYTPDSAARTMVTKRTHAFALLVPNLADPNVSVIASGTEARAREANYVMFLAGHNTNAVGETSGSFYSEHRVDGLMLMSPRYFPEVDLGLPKATLEEAPVDNYHGGTLAAAHLQSFGHQDVAFVGGLSESPHTRERLAGLSSNGFLKIVSLLGDWSAECGFTRTQQVLDHHPRVTAIFAASDAVALGVLNALHSRGHTVPGEFSVLGFDDLTAAKYYWPPLTTVKQPLKAVGAAAFDILLARIEKRKEPTRRPLPVELIVRGSTGFAKRRDKP